jgi:hypothetical protein
MDSNKLLAIIEQAKKNVNTAIHIDGVSGYAATGKPEDIQAIAQLLRRLGRDFEYLSKECEKLAGATALSNL